MSEDLEGKSFVIWSKNRLGEITPDFLKALEKEHIRLVIVEKLSPLEIKELAQIQKETGSICCIRLGSDEETKIYENELLGQIDPIVFEIKKMPSFENIKELCLRNKEKQRVPRTIGQPKNKRMGTQKILMRKRGGR